MSAIQKYPPIKYGKIYRFRNIPEGSIPIYKTKESIGVPTWSGDYLGRINTDFQLFIPIERARESVICLSDDYKILLIESNHTVVWISVTSLRVLAEEVNP